VNVMKKEKYSEKGRKRTENGKMETKKIVK
jgi:hypothetical protein